MTWNWPDCGWVACGWDSDSSCTDLMCLLVSTHVVWERISVMKSCDLVGVKNVKNHQITPNALQMSTSPTPLQLQIVQVHICGLPSLDTSNTSPQIKNQNFSWRPQAFCVDFRSSYIKSLPFPFCLIRTHTHIHTQLIVVDGCVDIPYWRRV